MKKHIKKAFASLIVMSLVILLYSQPIVGEQLKGTVAVWGDSDNDYGQFDVPEWLTDVVEVASAGSHVLALRANGSVVAWGYNSEGQCDVPYGLKDVVSIESGLDYSVALKADGTVVAWGDNARGQCDVPLGLTDVVEVAAGLSHTLALKADGTVVAWGSNLYDESSVPEGLTDVLGVAAGVYYSVVLMEDGRVLTWGHNDYGLLDPPAELSNVVAISASFFHVLALKEDGTVEAWGNDSEGQSDVPQRLKDVVEVAAGYEQSFALKENGMVVVWGDTSSGKYYKPYRLTDVVSIAAGPYHVAALSYEKGSSITKAFMVFNEEDYFSDVPVGHEYYEEAQFAFENGILNGYVSEDNQGNVIKREARPDVEITRAEYFAVMNRIVGNREDGTSSPFNDIQDKWYASDAEKAYDNGLTTGKTATSFAGDDKVTEEEAVVLLARVYGIEKRVSDELIVSDYSVEGEPWSACYYRYLKTEGIISENTKVSTKIATRAFAAIDMAVKAYEVLHE